MRLELEPNAEPPPPPPGISGALRAPEPMDASPLPENETLQAAPAGSASQESDCGAWRLCAGPSLPASDAGDHYDHPDQLGRPLATMLQGGDEVALAQPALRSAAERGVSSPAAGPGSPGLGKLAGPRGGSALAGSSTHSSGLPGSRAQQPDQAPAPACAPTATQAALRICVDSALNLHLPAPWHSAATGGRSSFGEYGDPRDAVSAPNGLATDGRGSVGVLGRAHCHKCGPGSGPAAADEVTAVVSFVWPPSGERVTTAPACVVLRPGASPATSLGAHLGPCAGLGGARWGFAKTLFGPAAGGRLSGALELQVWLRPGSEGCPARPPGGVEEDANGAFAELESRPANALLGVARVDLAPLGCLGELRGWYHIYGPGCKPSFPTVPATLCVVCACRRCVSCKSSRMHCLQGLFACVRASAL